MAVLGFAALVFRFVAAELRRQAHLGHHQLDVVDLSIVVRVCTGIKSVSLAMSAMNLTSKDRLHLHSVVKNAPFRQFRC